MVTAGRRVGDMGSSSVPATDAELAEVAEAIKADPVPDRATGRHAVDVADGWNWRAIQPRHPICGRSPSTMARRSGSRPAVSRGWR